MANVDHNSGAAGSSKNTPRGGAASKAGRAADAGSRSSEAGARQAADEARAVEVAVDKTAEASSAAANANAELVSTPPATGQEPMRSGLDIWMRTFEGLSQSWTQAVGIGAPNPGLAGRAPASFHAVSSSAAANGAWGAWLELTQRSLRTNLEAMSQLANCRSVPEVVSVQSNLLRSNLQQALESGEIIARAAAPLRRSS
jgi:hypothetical protein